MEIRHPSQTAVFVGEFYERLAQKLFGAKRVHRALEEYGLVFNGVPAKRNGAVILPDLYVTERQLHIEVKATQVRSASKICLEQLDAFEKLGEKVVYVFFRYNFRSLTNAAKTADKLVEILLEKTVSMFVVDIKIVSRIAGVALEGWNRYGSIYEPTVQETPSGTRMSWKGGGILQLKPRFFIDASSPEEEARRALSANLGFNAEEITINKSREEGVSFALGNIAAFERIDVSYPPPPHASARGFCFCYHIHMAKVQWIDIFNPGEKELKELGKKFGIHPIILDELRGPSTRSHAELHKNYIYLVYYFPIFDPVEEISVMTEVDFLITKSAVVTVRYENLAALQNVKHKTAETPLRLTYYIIQALLRFQERQLSHVREKTEAVGRELFKNREKEVLRYISKVKRDVSEYRLIVKHEGPILRSLMEKCAGFGNDEDKLYLSDLMGDYIKIINQLDSYREAIMDFEDTNNQIMNVKINEVMRTFTTLSFLTFPFMLIAAIFSMDTGGTPFSNNPYGFWIVFTGMAVAMIILISYFKKRDWI